MLSPGNDLTVDECDPPFEDLSFFSVQTLKHLCGLGTGLTLCIGYLATYPITKYKNYVQVEVK